MGWHFLGLIKYENATLMPSNQQKIKSPNQQINNSSNQQFLKSTTNFNFPSFVCQRILLLQPFLNAVRISLKNCSCLRLRTWRKAVLSI
jgi:hypothetical protein